MSGTDESTIYPKGDKAPPDYFTGTVRFRMLVPDSENTYNCQVYNVVFEPGARTHWHTHPGGQLLLVTDGKGYYQERGKTARSLGKGNVVEIPINVEHWHGAAPDSQFTHIGISSNTQEGPADWCEAVSDEDYKEATG